MTGISSGEGWTVADLITSNLPRPTSVTIEPDTEISALGIDSIGRMGIAIDITDQTGREVSDCEVERWITVGDVARSLGA